MKNKIIILLSVLAIVSLGMGIYFYFENNKESKDVKNDTTVTNATIENEPEKVITQADYKWKMKVSNPDGAIAYGVSGETSKNNTSIERVLFATTDYQIVIPYGTEVEVITDYYCAHCDGNFEDMHNSNKTLSEFLKGSKYFYVEIRYNGEYYKSLFNNFEILSDDVHYTSENEKNEEFVIYKDTLVFAGPSLLFDEIGTIPIGTKVMAKKYSKVSNLIGVWWYIESNDYKGWVLEAFWSRTTVPRYIYEDVYYSDAVKINYLSQQKKLKTENYTINIYDSPTEKGKVISAIPANTEFIYKAYLFSSSEIYDLEIEYQNVKGYIHSIPSIEYDECVKSKYCDETQYARYLRSNETVIIAD